MAKKIVITGGPCTGKSTTLKEIEKLAYETNLNVYTIPEVAREVIDEQLAIDGDLLPWKKRKEFQAEVLKRQLKYESQVPENSIVFIDRGLHDCIAYYELDGTEIPKEMIDAVEYKRYDGVIMLDRLPVYVNDSGRKENEVEAKRIHEKIYDVYCRYGYRPINIGVKTPRERAEEIIKYIKTYHSNSQ